MNAKSDLLVDTALNTVGLTNVLKALLRRIKKQIRVNYEPYLEQLQTDLETTLENYEARYK